MIRKTLALAPLMLAVSLAQAAETVKVYNWSDYIAPDTTKNFEKRRAWGSPMTSTTATKPSTAS